MCVVGQALFPELLGGKEPPLRRWGHDFQVSRGQTCRRCSVKVWWGGWSDSCGSFLDNSFIPWEMVTKSKLKAIFFSVRKALSLAGLPQGRVEIDEFGSIYHCVYLPVSSHFVLLPWFWHSTWTLTAFPATSFLQLLHHVFPFPLSLFPQYHQNHQPLLST